MRLNQDRRQGVGVGYGVSEGGVSDLNALLQTEKNQLNGFPSLDEDGFVRVANTELHIGDFPVMLDGPEFGIRDQAIVYKITNFNSWKEYTLSTSHGTISRNGDEITLLVSVQNTTQVNFKVNGRDFYIYVHGQEIVRPTITQTNNGYSVTLTGSPFAVENSSDTFAGAVFQVAKDANFTQIVKESAELQVLTTTFNGFELNTGYFCRVRYRGNTLGWSMWSEPVVFSTPASATVNTPTIITPSTNNIPSTQDPLGFDSSDFGVTASSQQWQDTLQQSEWQFALDSAFTNVIHNTTSATKSVNVPKSTLNVTAGSTFYVRVRHKGTNLPVSAWSATRTIMYGGVVQTPSISGNTTGYSSQAFSLTGSAYSSDGAAMGGAEWQTAFNSSFTNPTTTPTTGTSRTFNSTHGTGTYTLYVRVRYRDVNNVWSSYSPTFAISVGPQPASLFAPSIDWDGVAGGVRIFASIPSGSNEPGNFQGFGYEIVVNGSVSQSGTFTGQTMPDGYRMAVVSLLTGGQVTLRVWGISSNVPKGNVATATVSNNYTRALYIVGRRHGVRCVNSSSAIEGVAGRSGTVNFPFAWLHFNSPNSGESLQNGEWSFSGAYSATGTANAHAYNTGSTTGQMSVIYRGISNQGFLGTLETDSWNIVG